MEEAKCRRYADLVLYASNNIHRAPMGGVVMDWVADTMISGQTIADAYMPGQIRMGPLWDPFGQSQSELSVNWWRALAHELATTCSSCPTTIWA